VSFNESVTPTKPKTLFAYLLKRLMSLMSREKKEKKAQRLTKIVLTTRSAHACR
jgi:hypothetical protein